LIGIIDFDKQKNVRSSQVATGNAISYWAFNGMICPCNINSGTTLKVGETVTVSINRMQKTITWAVEDSVKYSLTYDMLAN
jgi:hypothetical protein